MIEYINNRLNAWAQWALSSRVAGLGFPRQSIYTRLQGRVDVGARAPELDEEAFAIDRAVIHLGHAQPQLHQVVVLYYLRTATTAQIAAECECCSKTLYNRLHRAHVAILDWLNDDAAGVSPAQVRSGASRQREPA